MPRPARVGALARLGADFFSAPLSLTIVRATIDVLAVSAVWGSYCGGSRSFAPLSFWRLVGVRIVVVCVVSVRIVVVVGHYRSRHYRCGGVVSSVVLLWRRCGGVVSLLGWCPFGSERAVVLDVRFDTG
jgi:hypothetical protein